MPLDAANPEAPARRPPEAIDIEAEMERSAAAYGMSVVVSRALPDVRDGLKPVHRRILFGMAEGYSSRGPHKKSARVVGDVMGKYHPHGDSAIYEAMARMAQDFSLRTPLVDGQGNFGSADGDGPAAMRYTEARLHPFAEEALLADLGEGTVPFVPNYDGTETEPSVLPARVPHLLVNGSEGIAYAMATAIPPHNLREVVDAALLVAERGPGVPIEDIMRVMPGPDFPSGGVVLGQAGVRDAYETGRGVIRLSGVAAVEAVRGGRQAVVVTELPPGVRKGQFVAAVTELATPSKGGDGARRPPEIEGVQAVRDESNRDGNRVVIELQRGADPEVVLNRLRRLTKFVSSYSQNTVCIDAARTPRTLGVREILSHFLAFRRQAIADRSSHRLDAIRDAVVREVALFAARSRVDEVVSRIRGAGDRAAAIAALMAMPFDAEGDLLRLLREMDPDVPIPPVYHLSEAQAAAVVELRLQFLTRLDLDNVAARARELMAQIPPLVEILESPAALDAVMRQEMLAIRDRYATPRRTRIEETPPEELDDESLVEDRPLVVTITRAGWVKATAVGAFREQARGGKGKTGMDTRDDDVVARTLFCSARDKLLFFTDRGAVHASRAWRLPSGDAGGRGQAIAKILPIEPGEGVAAVCALPRDAGEIERMSIVFATASGAVRRNPMGDFAQVKRGGKTAMRIEEDGDRIVAAIPCPPGSDVVLATRGGMAVRFDAEDAREMRSRTSTGIRGIHLDPGDRVVSACLLRSFQASSAERDAFLSGGSAQVDDPAVEGGKRLFVLPPGRAEEMRAVEERILVVTSGGFGKHFSSHDFRRVGRGGKGVAVADFDGPRTGDVVALVPVSSEDGLVLVTDGGQSIRTRVAEVRAAGRATRGVRLFDLPEGQRIVDLALIPADRRGGPIAPPAAPTPRNPPAAEAAEADNAGDPA